MIQDSTGQWVSKKKELLSWQVVKDELSRLTEPCDGGVSDLLVVPSERSSKLRKVFDRLEGAEFEGYQHVASDGFVDVRLERKLPMRLQ